MFALAKVHFDDNAVEASYDWHGLISFALIIIHVITLMDSRYDKTYQSPIFACGLNTQTKLWLRKWGPERVSGGKEAGKGNLNFGQLH